jgi:hypothetical protein
MTLTDEDVGALVAVLPGCTDAHRRSLLPRILREWSRIDLEEHLTRSTPRQIRAERQQINKVAKRARELAQALSELEPDGRFVIAGQLVEAGAGSRFGLLSHEDSFEADRRLDEAQKRLEELAKAATEAHRAFVPLPNRHETLLRYLVLLDLAAIYEWATRQRAGRRVGTDTSARPGETYGPFWDFASVAWPIIFESVAGVDYALKTWADARRRYKEKSPIIGNLHLRHPEWRIFEADRSRSTISKD